MILRRLFPQHGPSIIRAMMRVLPLLFLCAAANAAEVRVPSAPPPAHFDTESVTNAPPARLFSSDWDAVRLTVRGTDERDEALSVRLDTDAGVLILR